MEESEEDLEGKRETKRWREKKERGKKERGRLEVSYRDVPDPDTSIRYPVKFRYPVVSGIR